MDEGPLESKKEMQEPQIEQRGLVVGVDRDKYRVGIVDKMKRVPMYNSWFFGLTDQIQQWYLHHNVCSKRGKGVALRGLRERGENIKGLLLYMLSLRSLLF